MYSSIRQLRILGLSVLTGSLLLSACATKKFVREQVATLDPKINTISQQAKENSERIDAVDRRATQGITEAKTDAAGARTVGQQGVTAAATAQTAAQGAQTTATGAQTAAQAAQTTATQANQGVTAANTRIGQVDAKIATVDTYTQSGQIQSVMFDNDSFKLNDAAKQALDSVAGSVKNLKSGYALELIGYTDNRGDEGYNLTLSQRRTDSVLRYLVTQGVALSRIAVVGQGEESPKADNKTKDGRAQNRRVEVKVLKSPISN